MAEYLLYYGQLASASRAQNFFLPLRYTLDKIIFNAMPTWAIVFFAFQHKRLCTLLQKQQQQQGPLARCIVKQRTRLIVVVASLTPAEDTYLTIADAVATSVSAISKQFVVVATTTTQTTAPATETKLKDWLNDFDVVGRCIYLPTYGTILLLAHQAISLVIRII
uniref:Uncharacterized protein n=1 Tax=Glossina austeni TaxID=7395 RepID=A0A1A9VA83_GLOAU